ncbi:MAG TPA: RNA ligase (ATP) [Polyangiaceae bacterium]|nr:RNA ligase (ATP) [Polyangiaceae bacterium]
MEEVTYLGLPRCLRLANPDASVIVATAIGPRVLFYGRTGGRNALGECPGASVTTALGEFKPWGGHRLWVAPEAMPASYAPDNEPVRVEARGERAVALGKPADGTGVEKQIDVSLDPSGTGVTLRHRLTNRGPAPIELAPWALTILRPGGVVLVPHEEFRAHADYLLPARPLVLWHYTDMSDPRWAFGPRFVRLRCDASRPAPQKVGALVRRGYAAYHEGGELFVKSVAFAAGAAYPDYGCNVETFTAGEFVELETLGPLARLAPGEAAEHVERWRLFDGVALGGDDAALEAAIAPLAGRAFGAGGLASRRGPTGPSGRAADPGGGVGAPAARLRALRRARSRGARGPPSRASAGAPGGGRGALEALGAAARAVYDGGTVSIFAVTVEQLREVWPHPNADRLELGRLGSMSYQFVLAKGAYKAGDRVVYFPIDSVLPAPLVERLGLSGKLAGASKDRVKTVRLRGEISQGVVASLDVLPPGGAEPALGEDVTARLGVTKYEPPPVTTEGGELVPLPPLVSVYDIEGCERFQALLESYLLDAPVAITEKLEGSHFAASVGASGEVSVCQRRFRIRPVDGVEHTWHALARASGVLAALPAIARELGGPSTVTLRGEIIGPGVQGNHYRLPARRLVAFEIEADGAAVDAPTFFALCERFGLEHAPALARGATLREWLGGRTIAAASDGPSALNPAVAREGVVVRPWREVRDPSFGRVILKQRSPAYLAQSDY